MDKSKIIGIGLGGLVGSRISEILSPEFEFIPLSISEGIDITKPETLTEIKEYSEANFILHLAAKADVDGDLGEEGEAWKINVQGTANVAEIARETGKKIIYISTDFVFDGTKPEGEFYVETDNPNPLNWYAETKYQGEVKVEESGADYIILRIAYPYRAAYELKPDFMRAIKKRLEDNLPVAAVTDHIFCPTLIDDIAIAIGALVKNDAKGIYHAVGSEPISPYDAVIQIAETFNLDKSLISKTTREEFFKDRAKRPFNVALKNDKIEQLGVKMKGFSEGLHIVKSQLQ
jgi:dTDP-4-dehydrorhamnose reductase